MPTSYAYDRRCHAESVAVYLVQRLREKDWTARNEHYRLLVDIGRRGGPGAEFAAMVATYVRDMMGSDELLEGQNLTRRFNMEHAPCPMHDIAPPRRVYDGHRVTGQMKLENYWGVSAMRVTHSSTKCVKKQAKITRWASVAKSVVTKAVHAAD